MAVDGVPKWHGRCLPGGSGLICRLGSRLRSIVHRIGDHPHRDPVVEVTGVNDETIGDRFIDFATAVALPEMRPRHSAGASRPVSKGLKSSQGQKNRMPRPVRRAAT